MEYKTEVGKVLQAFKYREDVCKKFDELAMWLTLIPFRERDELLGSLIWYFGISSKLIEEVGVRFDKTLEEINK